MLRADLARERLRPLCEWPAPTCNTVAALLLQMTTAGRLTVADVGRLPSRPTGMDECNK